MDKKQIPLRWSMIVTLFICWLLPLVLISCALLYFASSMITKQIEKTVVISMDKAVEICSLQLNEVITASKNASYNGTVKNAYQQYKEDDSRPKLSVRINDFLNLNYQYNSAFLCTVIFLLENPDNIYFTYNTYQSSHNQVGAYTNVRYVREHAMEAIIEESPALDTGIKLIQLDGHLYIIRNIMDSSFQPFAMIIIELDVDSIFDSLYSVWGSKEYEFYLDGKKVLKNGSSKDFDEELLDEVNGHSVFVRDSRAAYAYKTIENGSQKLSFVVQLDSESIIDDLVMIRYVFFTILIFIIPLIYLVFKFFYNKVTKPVDRLISAAKEIAGKNYGYQITDKSSSQEFSYLNDAFNSMSGELKYQFEKIYMEELALKDANIMALQSQINPHFLNNTLEIINWEARLNGSDKVSGMIEALATMLNATMNRKQRRFVPLSEELSYVDAYLYIIAARFGDRFEAERQIDEKLLNVEVPILIIQPIVENAVEHSVETSKKGKVGIHIYSDGEKLYIEVKNSGVLTNRDKEKIEYLLGTNLQPEDERHVSLGIRNVNKRLKIIYGEECGLTIKNDEESNTVSTIIVKISNQGNKSQ